MDAIHIVLCSPQIPHNTGNIIRLCANTGLQLHLIHPLGFDLNNPNLKRAALDYSDIADVYEYSSFNEYKTIFSDRRILATSSSGNTIYSSIQYTPNDSILFGSEDTGLPEKIINIFENNHLIRIPMQPANRSINLSNAVAIVAYETWRQANFIGDDQITSTKHFS